MMLRIISHNGGGFMRDSKKRVPSTVPIYLLKSRAVRQHARAPLRPSTSDV